MPDWIYIGENNIRGEYSVSNPDCDHVKQRGPLIRPFEPFDCGANWRASIRKNARVDRLVMTVDDYEKRLESLTLAQLFNETRRRDIGAEPVNVNDAQWVLRPHTAVEEIITAWAWVNPEPTPEEPRPAPVRELTHESIGAKMCMRYAIDPEALLAHTPEQQRRHLVLAVTAYICERLGKTEAEIRGEIIANLMRPLRIKQTDPVDDIETRRAEVARLSRLGVTQGKIAEELGVSRGTIQNDLRAMKQAEAS